MKFISILLNEGRKEDLMKKYSDKFHYDDLEFILNVSDFQDYNHKYTDWVLKNLDPDTRSLETDVDVAVELIKEFDKLQSQLEKRDINQYKSFFDLDKALIIPRQKQQQKEDENKIKKIYEDSVLLVVRPLSLEASCKYGAGTRWCTTQRGQSYFENHTAPGKALYYVIMKNFDKSNKFYKVAIHKDREGRETWWNSNDDPMNTNEQDLFKLFGQKALDEINKDYSEDKATNFQQEMERIFGTERSYELVKVFQNQTVTLKLNNTHVMEDMPGHFTMVIGFFLNGEQKAEGLVMMSARLDKKDSRWVKMDVGMDSESENFDTDYGMDFDGVLVFILREDPNKTFEDIATRILTKCLTNMSDNLEFKKLVYGGASVWDKSRVRHGYTFATNKGLVKKLVDWLDKGLIGTKLDFLVDIGKLKKKVVDGKELYSLSSGDTFSPKSQFRGHFSSFFSTAKHAGILDYRKVGGQYFLKKGPNFEAFKEGKLKAL